MGERLTFGFKNTELLFGALIFSAIFTFLFFLMMNVNFNIYLILFQQILWGLVFGSVFRMDHILKDKGYLGAFCWAVALISPITFIVYSFNSKEIVKFINKI